MANDTTVSHSSDAGFGGELPMVFPKNSF